MKIPNQQTLIKNWLILAISSLAVAGLFSLPPVILRGSFFADKLPVELIFSTALVIHVDLSVLIWFLSIGGMLWSFLAEEKQFWLYKIAFYLAAAGMVTISLSPFIGESHPIKNNYIPVLQNPVFFIGLSLFTCGMLFQITLTLLNIKKATQNLYNQGLYISALITAIAAICFVIAHKITPVPTDGDFQWYYESLFWGGGHVLQFTFTTLMLVTWIWLANICHCTKYSHNNILLYLLLLNLILVIPSPLFYILDNTRDLFTQQMRYGNGISALFIGATILTGAFFNKEKLSTPHLVKSTLVLSIILFGYGGMLGYMISGVNVTIPAHYHGSIVAITMAFMGLVYYLLPQLKYSEVRGKIANAQPYIYGIGQIMHITGLAWMGGYGALRKDAASSQNIDTVAGKLLFFAGGSIAILGGLLFVIVVIMALLKKRK